MEAWALALQRRPDLLDRMRAFKGWTAGACAALDVGWDGERFTFSHRAADGRLVGVARYLPGGDPKTLPYGRGHGRDLFPKPELLRDETVVGADGRRVALRDRYPLHLVEGESDAVTACALSEPGSPFFGIAVPGANGWRPEWAQRFAGWAIRILVDHDDAGRGLAERLSVDLTPHAREVRLIAWPEVLGHEPPRGFDLGDYAALGQTPALVAA